MKSLDLTKPGGLGLTQNRLAYLQTGWTEALLGLSAGMGASSGNPVALQGAVVSKNNVAGTMFHFSISGGWILYDGNLIRVVASGTLTIDTSTNDAFVQITSTSTPLTYNNGSTPNVVNDITATLVSMPIGTGDSSGLFLASELEYYTPEQVLQFQERTDLNGDTIAFTKPLLILYDNTFAVNSGTFTLDFTNAVPGVEVTITVPISGTGAPTLTTTLHHQPVLMGAWTVGSGGKLNMRIKFLGKAPSPGNAIYYSKQLYAY